MTNILDDLAHRSLNIPSELGKAEEIPANIAKDGSFTWNATGTTPSWEAPAKPNTNGSVTSVEAKYELSTHDIRQEERARINSVMCSEHYPGREELAKKLMLETDMTAAQITEMLSAAPAKTPEQPNSKLQQEKSAFEQAMNKHGQTNILAEEHDDGEQLAKTPEKVSSNIFDHFGLKKKGE